MGALSKKNEEKQRFSSEKVQRAKALLEVSQKPVVLTGAGISVASGLPSFRGSGSASLWSSVSLLRFAYADAWQSDPAASWKLYEDARFKARNVRPNQAHLDLAQIAKRKPGLKLFTQNVDGLHGAAGQHAIEIHGSLHRLRCQNTTCANIVPLNEKTAIPYGSVVCPVCKGSVRHDVVLFNEPVQYLAEMEDALNAADLVIFIGTSGEVTDTKMIAEELVKNQVPVIEINPAMVTPSTFAVSIYIREKAEHVLCDL